MQIQPTIFKTESEKLNKIETTNSVTVLARDNICGNCHKTPAKSICGRCKVVYYCDQTCQKNDWPKHKLTCESPKELNERTEIKKTLNGLKYDPSLESVINKILNSPPALNLLKKVLADGPLNIEFGNTPQGAVWKLLQRCIIISICESASRQLGHLLFELANATQYKQQQKIAEDCQRGIVDKDEYVMRWERIEYTALTIATPIIEESINKYQWPKDSILDFGKLLKIGCTWNKFWDLINKLPHAEQFRKDWDLNIKPMYTKTHSKIGF